MRLFPVDARITRLPCLLLFPILATGLAPSLPAFAASLEATTSRTSKEEAVAKIPFDQLTEEVQEKLRKVVTSPSIYRRMPVKAIECDPELYLFMIRYPEVVVNIWEVMGLTNIKVNRTGPFTFRAADGSGASGDIDLVYGNQNTHVFYVNAEYSGALIKRKINGQCVLVLTSEYMRTEDNRSQVISRLDMFLQLDNVGAELMAKTLQPLVGKAADHNFVETAAFLSRVSQAAQTNSFGVQQLSNRLANVAPEVRAEFGQIAGRVGGAADPAAASLAASEIARFRIEPPARLQTTAAPIAEGGSSIAPGAIDSVDQDEEFPTPTTIGPFGPRKGMLLKR
jgi:hypothetical protein